MRAPSEWASGDDIEKFGEGLLMLLRLFWLKESGMVFYCMLVVLCCSQAKSPILLSATVLVPLAVLSVV